MEIEIKKIKEKRKYLEEAMTINAKRKELLNNPHLKLYPYTTRAVFIIISFSILAILLFIAIQITKMYYFYIVIGFIILFIGIIGYSFINTKKYINKEEQKETDSTITINKNNIIMKNKNQKATVEMQIDEINSIIFTDNSIIFLNKEIENYSIIIPIDYKEEILKQLKKNKLEQLIIYNKEQ